MGIIQWLDVGELTTQKVIVFRNDKVSEKIVKASGFYR